MHILRISVISSVFSVVDATFVSPELMESQQGKDIVFDKFTWKIENFSKLNTANLRSKAFKIYGYKWY